MLHKLRSYSVWLSLRVEQMAEVVECTERPAAPFIAPCRELSKSLEAASNLSWSGS